MAFSYERCTQVLQPAVAGLAPPPNFHTHPLHSRVPQTTNVTIPVIPVHHCIEVLFVLGAFVRSPALNVFSKEPRLTGPALHVGSLECYPRGNLNPAHVKTKRGNLEHNQTQPKPCPLFKSTLECCHRCFLCSGVCTESCAECIQYGA